MGFPWLLWFSVVPTAVEQTMKIKPPIFSWLAYCAFVLVVSLPPLGAWFTGNGDMQEWLRTALYAGSAYWGIYWLWWAASVVTGLPPRPRR